MFAERLGSQIEKVESEKENLNTEIRKLNTEIKKLIGLKTHNSDLRLTCIVCAVSTAIGDSLAGFENSLPLIPIQPEVYRVIGLAMLVFSVLWGGLFSWFNFSKTNDRPNKDTE